LLCGSREVVDHHPERGAMSQAADPAESPEAAGPTSPIKRWLPVAGALVLGAAVGTIVVVPRISGAKPAADAAHQPSGKSDGHGGEGGASASMLLENVIVNPAGSFGSRYVIASVEFEFASPDIAGVLQARENAVRDAVGSVLERLSIEQLTQPGSREAVRHQLDSVAAAHAGSHPTAVHLPQFLIQ
jgi:flagellar FliL protein